MQQLKSQLLETANKLIEDADREINRSSEDVVTYGVCHNTRNAISAYLNAFLMTHGEPKQDLPPDKLLEKCAKLDGRFSEFDLSTILCKHETTTQNDCFCTDPKKVQDCLDVAMQIGRIVAEQSPAY
jgi:hypothetical protein